MLLGSSISKWFWSFSECGTHTHTHTHKYFLPYNPRPEQTQNNKYVMKQYLPSQSVTSSDLFYFILCFLKFWPWSTKSKFQKLITGHRPQFKADCLHLCMRAQPWLPPVSEESRGQHVYSHWITRSNARLRSTFLSRYEVPWRGSPLVIHSFIR